MNRRFAHLPPDRHLTPAITTLAAEATDLFARARAARDVVDRLADPSLDETAHRADLDARGAAVRAGKPASSVGSPQTDELAQRRADALAEYEALHAAATQVEDDIRDAFAKLRADGHGTAAVHKTRAAYRKGLDGLPGLRAAYLEAASVVRFIDHAAGEQYAALPDDLRSASRGASITGIPSNGDRIENQPPMPAERLVGYIFGPDFADDPTTPEGEAR